jgi:hypothetical protein
MAFQVVSKPVAKRPYKSRPGKPAKEDYVGVRASKSGGARIIVSQDVIKRVGFTKDTKVMVLKGTDEDEGFLQVRPIEAGERGRLISVQQIQTTIPIDADLLGIAAPEKAMQVEYDPRDGAIEIDVRPLLKTEPAEAEAENTTAEAA